MDMYNYYAQNRQKSCLLLFIVTEQTSQDEKYIDYEFIIRHFLGRNIFE